MKTGINVVILECVDKEESINEKLKENGMDASDIIQIERIESRMNPITGFRAEDRVRIYCRKSNLLEE